MKFLRQFGAAVAVVTVVVLAGLAWDRLAPSLPGEGPAGHALAGPAHGAKVVPPGGKLARDGKLAPGRGRPLPAGAGGAVQLNGGPEVPGLMLGDLLEPVNLVVLRSTVLLEAAVIAAVVLADAGYRRLRRARRVRTSQSRAAPE